MVENCCINGFLKWSISYIVGNKKTIGKICILNWEINETVSLQEWSLGVKGERRSERKWARLYLKVSIDEGIS